MPRTKSQELTKAQRRVFEDAAWDVYNKTAPDVWGESVPSKTAFVGMIMDLMGDSAEQLTDLDAHDIEVWRGLSRKIRREIISAVGP